MRSVDACLFAGIDRDRLNEAIAAGLYSHAPKTVGGKARVFGEKDLVALKVFAELVRFGYGKRQANKMTGKIMKCGSISFHECGLEVCKINFNLPFLAATARAALSRK